MPCTSDFNEVHEEGFARGSRLLVSLARATAATGIRVSEAPGVLSSVFEMTSGGPRGPQSSCTGCIYRRGALRIANAGGSPRIREGGWGPLTDRENLRIFGK